MKIISETTKERGVRGHEISISLERKRHTTSKAKQKGETNKSKKEETRERELWNPTNQYAPLLFTLQAEHKNALCSITHSPSSPRMPAPA